MSKDNIPNRFLTTQKSICWQITNVCNRHCEFCISKSSPHKKKSENDRRLIIKRFRQLGVERVSISGGEPFEFHGLNESLACCKKLGIKTMITTNGDYLAKSIPEWVFSIKPELNFSFYGNLDYHDSIMGAGHYAKLKKLCHTLSSHISLGANFMLTQKSVKHIEEFLTEMKTIGADRILFLRYMHINNKLKNEAILNSTKNICHIIRKILTNRNLTFDNGVRVHDYQKDAFVAICDQIGDILLLDVLKSEYIRLGSVFDETLSHPIRGLSRTTDMFEFFYNRKLTSEGLIALQ